MKKNMNNYDIDLIIDYILEKYYSNNKPRSSKYIPYKQLFPEKYGETKTNNDINKIWEKMDLKEVNISIFKNSALKEKINIYFNEKNSNEDYNIFFNDNKKFIKNFLEYNEEKIKEINKEKREKFGYEIQKINNRIKNNFKDKKGYLTPGFYSYKQFNDNAPILFIGMNPAGDKVKDFGEIGDVGINNDFKKIIISKNSKFYNYSTYYGVFETMFGHFHTGKWNQVDLFQYRGTKQEDVVKLLDNTSFWKKQYEILETFIELLKPKIIVVANGYASKYLKEKWYSNDNQEIGDEGYWDSPFKVNNKKISVLFTGSLTGQRALDIGSRELLKWKIEDILK